MLLKENKYFDLDLDLHWMQAIKRAMLEDQSWYNAELTEMLKKGGVAALASQKMSDLKVLLKQPNKSWGQLRQSMVLFKEVKGTCRSQRLASVTSDFKATCLTV